MREEVRVGVGGSRGVVTRVNARLKAWGSTALARWYGEYLTIRTQSREHVRGRDPSVGQYVVVRPNNALQMFRPLAPKVP